MRASFAKHTPVDGPAQEDLDHAVKRKLVSQAVVSDQVIDIFGTAGLKAPDVSILSDEFLEDVRDMPQKNLALELLRKLLNDEIKSQSRTNLVQARSFAEMLDAAVRRYQNRTIDAAEVVTELIDLAKDMREAVKRGEEMEPLRRGAGLLRRASAEPESAIEVMGAAGTGRHRHRAGKAGSSQCNHRLDGEAVCPGEDACTSQAHPASIRLSA